MTTLFIQSWSQWADMRLMIRLTVRRMATATQDDRLIVSVRLALLAEFHSNIRRVTFSILNSTSHIWHLIAFRLLLLLLLTCKLIEQLQLISWLTRDYIRSTRIRKFSRPVTGHDISQPTRKVIRLNARLSTRTSHVIEVCICASRKSLLISYSDWMIKWQDNHQPLSECRSREESRRAVLLITSLRSYIERWNIKRRRRRRELILVR